MNISIKYTKEKKIDKIEVIASSVSSLIVFEQALREIKGVNEETLFAGKVIETKHNNEN